jgi:WD40 repeat protein
MKTKQQLAGLLVMTGLTVLGWGAGWSDSQPAHRDPQTSPAQGEGQKPAGPAPGPTLQAKATRLDQLGEPLPEGAVARLGPVRSKENGDEVDILCLAYAPDSQTLAGGSGDFKVRLWQVATGKELRVFTGHKADITSVAFTPDAKVMVSASRDGTVRLWSVATGKELRRFAGIKPNVPVTTLSRNGKTLLAANQDGTIQVWDVEQGKERQRFTLEDRAGPSSTAVSPDGRVLAANGHLWKVATGKKWRSIDLSPRKACRAMGFSHDGRLLATSESTEDRGWGWRDAKDDPVIRIWEVATGLEICKVEGLAEPAYVLAMSPQGRVLVHSFDYYAEAVLPVTDISSAQDLKLVMGDKGEGVTFPSGQGFRSLVGHRYWVKCVVFAPDGKTVATGSSDGTALVWNLARFLPQQHKAAVLSAQDLKGLWADLASQDARRSYRAMARMAVGPDATLPFLQKHLQPVATTDPRRLEQLIQDLDNPKYAVRQKAAVELEQLGELAEAALRKTVQGKVTLELRRRVELLLAKVDQGILPVDQLRSLRALTVLERIGSDEARHLVTAMAGGDPTAWLTQEAQAAVQRW